MSAYIKKLDRQILFNKLDTPFIGVKNQVMNFHHHICISYQGENYPTLHQPPNFQVTAIVKIPHLTLPPPQRISPHIPNRLHCPFSIPQTYHQ